MVELIGGTGAARRLLLLAIEAGKPVVTANKALLAQHGKEIFDAAAERGVDVAFEASVGGGIPILRAIREGLAANRIQSVHGIINGTTNYMLTRDGAQRGDASTPCWPGPRRSASPRRTRAPTSTASTRRTSSRLLAAMAFGAELTVKDIPTEGIRGIEPIDFDAAREFGYRIKLLAIAKTARRRRGGPPGRIEARVQPTMIPATSLLAKVDGAMNAVAVCGDAVGTTLYYGAGAGELPTASAVVADLIEIARELRRGSAGRVAPLAFLPHALARRELVPLGDLVRPRLSALHRPGSAGGARAHHRRARRARDRHRIRDPEGPREPLGARCPC